jgi:competence protein ComEA
MRQHTLFAASLIVAALALTALARTPSGRVVARSDRRVRPAASAQGVASLREGQPLDLNRAALGDLLLLPGVGPKLAERILEERARRAGFESVEQLSAVKGVGPKKLAQLRSLVAVGPRDPRATSR